MALIHFSLTARHTTFAVLLRMTGKVITIHWELDKVSCENLFDANKFVVGEFCQLSTKSNVTVYIETFTTFLIEIRI